MINHFTKKVWESDRKKRKRSELHFTVSLESIAGPIISNCGGGDCVSSIEQAARVSGGVGDGDGEQGESGERGRDGTDESDPDLKSSSDTGASCTYVHCV